MRKKPVEPKSEFLEAMGFGACVGIVVILICAVVYYAVIRPQDYHKEVMWRLDQIKSSTEETQRQVWSLRVERDAGGKGDR